MDSLAAAPQPPPPATTESTPPEDTAPSSMAADHENKNAAAQISNQEELLIESFVSLTTAIRLLRLKGSASNFSNVAPKVESLTKREFSRRNLAHLKFIFPEAIEITEELDHLRIELNLDSVSKSEKNSSSSLYMALRDEFRNRLANFYKHQPEGDEVPEAMLLDPVDQKSKQDREAESDDALLDELKPNPVVAASHFGPGFHRSLSTRVSKLESLEPCLNPGLGFEEADECSSVSVPFLPITPGKERRDGLDRIEACITTPAKRADSATQCKFTGDGLATPAKGIIDSSTPVCTATPALSTPKIRIMMSPDEKEESDALESANKLTKRTLKFDDTPVNDENVDSVTPVTAKAASLPKLFNTIDSLFRSGRSVMTKEEVIHKIIAAHLEFVNRGEVEEQLKLLGEVIPEWISEQMACSGDLIFSINKMSSLEAMRARLEEACPKEEGIVV
ncbi:CDT1-like protein a, chloroplastic [Linum perenne]